MGKSLRIKKKTTWLSNSQPQIYSLSSSKKNQTTPSPQSKTQVCQYLKKDKLCDECKHSLDIKGHHMWDPANMVSQRGVFCKYYSLINYKSI